MYEYHHMGLISDEPQEGEIYHEEMKFYSTPFLDNPYRIQWHRFDADCPLNTILKEKPHVAFKVQSIEKEIEGKQLLLGPYEPIPGYRVAIIEFKGAVIEFIETKLTDEELANLSEETP